MSHYRTDLRSAVRVAFEGSGAFSTVQKLSAWAQNVDWETLPVLGIATPREDKDQDALDSAERSVTLVVVLKRAGADDLEDVLDADSVEIERISLAAMRTAGWGAMLTSTEIDLSGAAEKRLGTLTMMFRALLQTPEPI